MGVHWAKAARMKKRDREIIGYSFLGKPKATGKRRVSLKIILKPGARGGDPDCWAKSVGDSLVHAGMLTDDNRQGVEWSPVTYERGTHFRWGTVISLEDI